MGGRVVIDLTDEESMIESPADEPGTTRGLRKREVESENPFERGRTMKRAAPAEDALEKESEIIKKPYYRLRKGVPKNLVISDSSSDGEEDSEESSDSEGSLADFIDDSSDIEEEPEVRQKKIKTDKSCYKTKGRNNDSCYMYYTELIGQDKFAITTSEFKRKTLVQINQVFNRTGSVRIGRCGRLYAPYGYRSIYLQMREIMEEKNATVDTSMTVYRVSFEEGEKILSGLVNSI
jgi:hypothetical protein